jgi:hypothetical protein
MDPSEVSACFDRFRVSAWRLETLQRYTMAAEQERIRGWQEGRALPQRSIRTDPWLRRVALSTVQGKQWGRVHLVERPLSDYMRYEIGEYIVSAVVGEEIRIAERAAHPGLAAVGPDFWLFDADSPQDAYAIIMSYGADGVWLGADLTRDPDSLERCRQVRDMVVGHSVPLNAYLASIGADALRQVT